jgi:Lrp/AsnC family leucine-responsive transcriptional regulator
LGAELDKVDIAIIRALQKDARVSFAEIAKTSGVSIDTISERLKKIKDIGVARGTTVLLNPKSFGCDFVASFAIRADYSHIEEVLGFLKKSPEIIFSTQTMGRHSIFAVAIVENMAKLNQFKESIKGNPMVREITTNIWVNDILLCPENFDLKVASGDVPIG